MITLPSNFESVVDISGKSLTDVSKIPTLKSPIKDIEKNIELVTRDIGGQLTSSVKIGNFSVEEVVTRQGGESARDFTEESFR